MRPKSSGWIALAGVLVVSCTAPECLTPPCPLPLAVTIHLTSATTGASVEGATLRVTGPVESTGPCQSSTCYVRGPAGSYTVTVEAPGFQTAERTVTVRGVAPQGCGCSSAVAERVDLALVPAA